MDDAGDSWRPELSRPPPELPRDPMEFLSRSWSASSLDVSKVLAPPAPASLLPPPAASIPEDAAGELEDSGALAAAVAGNTFSFASSATSQLVMERIMSQSEVSPLASGRLSHSSGPLNGGGSLSDSPPVSPSDMDDVKYCAAGNALKPQPYRGTTKTVGRWLKDRKEKKKEETRAQNAQLHAAISVAGVAAAVAAIAAATAAASGSGKDDRAARTDMAVASAATLVAAQCVEAAESMGAEREHLASVVSSAVNVRTPGDIVTLTAAAATALRGAATLKARALKEVWNIAAVIPVEKGGTGNHHNHRHRKQDKELDSNSSSFSDELVPEENFLGLCSQELLARGTELLKRTRKGSKLCITFVPICFLLDYTDYIICKLIVNCRSTTLEGCLSLHQQNGSSKSMLVASQILNALRIVVDFDVLGAGDAQDEEQACRRDYYQEEEE
ncbi:hypothetical protein Cni_G08142 [Canna indica]|uniref:VAN3-binding protein-like auxin canalisation domain-containing protein n=1 Tax=Canna indica TaxID=4628 RepID=A0AAQ3Q7M8_9LILI|nr:hypothetical protein Cni_G08142 [Canna indica]